MAWTNPTLRTSGELITANIWNADLVDNLLFLGNTHDHSGGAGNGGSPPATAAEILPSGVIMVFDTSCPSGWTRFSAFDGLYLRANNSYGGTGGGFSSHAHYGWDYFDLKHINVHDYSEYFNRHLLPVVTTSDTGADMYYSYTTGGSTTVYPVLPFFTTTSVAVEPPYIEVIFCKKN